MFANMHANVSGDQKRTSDPQKLWLQAVISGLMSVGNPILVLKTNL